MIDEGFVGDRAGLGLGPAGTAALDARTAALLQLGVSVAVSSPGVCLEWCTALALAAGAAEDDPDGQYSPVEPGQDGGAGQY